MSFTETLAVCGNVGHLCRQADGCRISFNRRARPRCRVPPSGTRDLGDLRFAHSGKAADLHNHELCAKAARFESVKASAYPSCTCLPKFDEGFSLGYSWPPFRITRMQTRVNRCLRGKREACVEKC